jgi:hypothetical protein
MISRLPLILSASLALSACADMPIDAETQELEAHAQVSFEDFLADCEETSDGLLCQGDMRIAADRDPYEFWSTFVARSPGQMDDGHDVADHHETPQGVGVAAQSLSRMGRQSDTNLTYCIRNVSPNGFNSAQAAVVRAGMLAAANMWAPHVSVRYQYVAAEDTHCDGANTRVDFHVRAMTAAEQAGRFAAFAFFPGDSRSQRGIAIRPASIPSSNNSGFTNLMAHELGHTLGFVHEQYRDATTGCQDIQRDLPMDADADERLVDQNAW